MHPEARAVDVDDDGVMDHPVDEGSGDDGVAEVISELLKINVAGDNGCALAIAGIDNFEEKGCVSGRFLFNTVKADFVDEQDLGSGIDFEGFLERAVAK